MNGVDIDYTPFARFQFSLSHRPGTRTSSCSDIHPKAAVEGFDKRVIRGFSGSGEVQRHLVLIGPFVERFGDELTPQDELDYPCKRTTFAPPPVTYAAHCSISRRRLASKSLRA